jgi:hypothetical protein
MNKNFYKLGVSFPRVGDEQEGVEHACVVLGDEIIADLGPRTKKREKLALLFSRSAHLAAALQEMSQEADEDTRQDDRSKAFREALRVAGDELELIAPATS